VRHRISISVIKNAIIFGFTETCFNNLTLQNLNDDYYYSHFIKNKIPIHYTTFYTKKEKCGTPSVFLYLYFIVNV
jgi:hypothetical protein